MTKYQREEYKRIREEHIAFKNRSADSVVSFEDCRQDKERMEILTGRFIQDVCSASEKIGKVLIASSLEGINYHEYIQTMTGKDKRMLLSFLQRNASTTATLIDELSKPS